MLSFSLSFSLFPPLSSPPPPPPPFSCYDLVAGIPPEMLVEAHGTFASATCTVCRRVYKGEDLRVSCLHFYAHLAMSSSGYDYELFTINTICKYKIPFCSHF